VDARDCKAGKGASEEDQDGGSDIENPHGGSELVRVVAIAVLEGGS
jgi:hypothetical protein